MLRSCNQILLTIVYIDNIFDPELQLINTKLIIENKLKELLGELKKLKVQTILVLDYKKRNNCKIFHSSTELVASDSDIDEAFKSMLQSIMTKLKKCFSRLDCFRCNCKP